MSYGDTPYSSPSMQPEFGQPQGAPGEKPKKPAGLLTVAILVLIFGIFGALGSLCGLGMSAGSGVIYNAMSDQLDKMSEGMSDEEAEQVKAGLVTYDAMRKNMVVMVIAGLVSAVVSIMMIVAGTMGLKNSPGGRKFIIITLVCCLISGVIGTGAQILNSMTTLSLIEQNFPNLADQLTMNTMIGIVFNVIISLVSFVGYGIMLGYMMRSKAVAAFYDSLQS